MRRSRKFLEAEYRAGQLALYYLQEAERTLWDYRERMHQHSENPAARKTFWPHVYKGARQAVVELRAIRMLYDRIPQRAKRK